VPKPLRVAYTLEQCWHDVPGGTAVAALAVASELDRRPDVTILGVVGRHRQQPAPPFVPTVEMRRLGWARPWLYETWNRWERPTVESATGPVDVCHSTTAIPAATAAPHVVTIHDVAFVHTPERFSRHGARVMKAGLERCRSADFVMCPSHTVLSDLVQLGFNPERLRVVPWGVDTVTVGEADVDRVRAAYRLPERFVLFVGTLEPRKNLDRLAAAIGRLDEPIALVVAGAAGWGDTPATHDIDCRFLGFVPPADLAPLYAAASVFAYPSLEEGFGLPVLEAMSQGAAVVTSSGTATEEVAGGAAVLIDPSEVDSIAEGLAVALVDPDAWATAARERAAAFSWAAAAEATVAVYREAIG
jgi:glycosyltransferase involved in cell wall biosynthesis